MADLAWLPSPAPGEAHYVLNTGRSREVRLPSNSDARATQSLSSDRKGNLEVTGLPEPTGLGHRDHSDLRAEGEG